MPTHGSLTKAGKVRSQTPKMDGREVRSCIPRYRVRRNYEKRLILKRDLGQPTSRSRPKRRRFKEKYLI